ncbi:MAG: hypothetical protein NT169_20070 [Chloroflexi bacterium]|nr:hypothetical protein [Chloroflexota bacterium]
MNTKRWVIQTAVIGRRVASLVILSMILALCVLSFLGNPLLSVPFIAVTITVLARHASSLCPRCSNLACAFNPHRASVAADVPQGPDCTMKEEFSDLPITRTTVIPFLVSGPVAFVGAWQYSPYGAVVVVTVLLAAHFVFQKLTCSHCGNNCVGNCNTTYQEWKAAQKRLVG